MQNPNPDLSADAPESPRRERNRLFDFMRGILITGVVAAHFGGYLVFHGSWPSTSVYIGIISAQLFIFALSGFLLLSGHALAKQYNKYPSILIFYGRRFRTVVVPYIVVSGVYTLWAALSPSHIGPHSFESFLYQFFIVGMDVPLYFVPVIVQCYLLFPLLAKCLSNSDGHNRNGIALFLILIGSHLLSGIFAHRGRLSYWLVRSSFLFWGPYFYAGMMLGFGRISKGSIHRLKRLAVPLLVLGAASLYYDTASIIRPQQPIVILIAQLGLSFVRPAIMIYNALISWVIVLIVLDSPQTSHRFIDWLGRNSLIIFLCHMPLLRFFRELSPFGKLSLDYPPVILIIVLATVTIAAFGSEIWRKAEARIVTYIRNYAPAISHNRNENTQR